MSAMTEVLCPRCSAVLGAAGVAPGTKVGCRRCGNVFPLPHPVTCLSEAAPASPHADSAARIPDGLAAAEERVPSAGGDEVLYIRDERRGFEPRPTSGREGGEPASSGTRRYGPANLAALPVIGPLPMYRPAADAPAAPSGGCPSRNRFGTVFLLFALVTVVTVGMLSYQCRSRRCGPNWAPSVKKPGERIVPPPSEQFTTQGLLRTLHGAGGPIEALAVSADGRKIAASSATGPIVVWDAEFGLELARLPVGREPLLTSLGFSPDGKVLAAGVGDEIALWSVGNDGNFRSAGRMLPFGTGTAVWSLSWVPADGSLAVVSGSSVRLFPLGRIGPAAHSVEPADSESRRTSGGPTETRGVHGASAVDLTGRLTHFALSPDGRQMAIGENGSSVRLFRAPADGGTEGAWTEVGGSRQVGESVLRGLCWIPGREPALVLATEHGLQLLHADKVRESRTLVPADADARQKLTSVVPVAGGAYVVATTGDGMVIRWDRGRTGSAPPSRNLGGQMWPRLAVNPKSGRLISAGADGLVRIWDQDRLFAPASPTTLPRPLMSPAPECSGDFCPLSGGRADPG